MPEWVKGFFGQTVANPAWWFSAVLVAFIVNYFTPDLRTFIERNRAKYSKNRRAKLEKAEGKKWKRIVETAKSPEKIAEARFMAIYYSVTAAGLVAAAAFLMSFVHAVTDVVKGASDTWRETGGVLVMFSLGMAFLAVVFSSSSNNFANLAVDAQAVRDGELSPPPAASPAPPDAQ